MAHAASLGRARDLDRPSEPWVPAFDLWARMMAEADAADLLHADISAVFQANRDTRTWRRVIENDAWHARLLHGSDHPLPGVMPLYAPQRLAQAGLLDASAVEPLRRIRVHNALLFDFVLKRHLRAGSAVLPASVFHTRDFFSAQVRT
jgi:mannonate dehydratase